MKRLALCALLSLAMMFAAFTFSPPAARADSVRLKPTLTALTLPQHEHNASGWRCGSFNPDSSNPTARTWADKLPAHLRGKTIIYASWAVVTNPIAVDDCDGPGSGWLCASHGSDGNCSTTCTVRFCSGDYFVFLYSVTTSSCRARAEIDGPDACGCLG